MIYSLSFNADDEEKRIDDGNRSIFAEETNIDEIKYANKNNIAFRNSIYFENTIKDWPNVEFYYDSDISNKEIEYLFNVMAWPIVHDKVKVKFELEKINGIVFYPIRLIDRKTGSINTNYYLMYVNNFIDGYDLDKSEYKYNEKYDHYNFLPHTTYLKKEICGQYDIFRCKKFTIPLYVSEKIKKIIEENQWIGFDFTKEKES